MITSMTASYLILVIAMDVDNNFKHYFSFILVVSFNADGN